MCVNCEISSSKMSENCEINCITYNIPLNNNKGDVFLTSCSNLYHFLHNNVDHDKSSEGKPVTFKMHLEFIESPLTKETNERNIQHNNSVDAAMQQYEEDIKTLKNALLLATNRIEDLEKCLANNGADKTTDVSNNESEGNSDKKNQQPNKFINNINEVASRTKTTDVSCKTTEGNSEKIQQKQKTSVNNVNKVEPRPQSMDVGNNTTEGISDKKQQQPNKFNNNANELESGPKTKDVSSKTNEGNSNEKQQQLKKFTNNANQVVSEPNNYVTIRILNLPLNSDNSNAWIEFATVMGISIGRDQIHNIETVGVWQNFTFYRVNFRTKDKKDSFLKYIQKAHLTRVFIFEN